MTQAGAIDQFMIRMKHSLRDAREMLSNTVAFWMVPELAHKNWDPAAVDIPGADHGLSRRRRGLSRGDPEVVRDPEKWAPVFGKDHAQTKS